MSNESSSVNSAYKAGSNGINNAYSPGIEHKPVESLPSNIQGVSKEVSDTTNALVANTANANYIHQGQQTIIQSIRQAQQSSIDGMIQATNQMASASKAVGR